MKSHTLNVESVQRFSSRKDKVTDRVEIRINGKLIIYCWGEKEQDIVISAQSGFFYPPEMERAKAIAHQKLAHFGKPKGFKKQGELF
jgi:hypothetical protein